MLYVISLVPLLSLQSKFLKSIFTYKIITAVLATGCFFLCSCENNPDDIKNLGKKKLGVEEAKNIRTIYTGGGKTKAILTSPLMLRVQDTIAYYEFPNTLAADFYGDDGKVQSKLTALYGKYKESQSIVFLKDSVKVINIQKGDTLYCKELYWDRSRTGTEFYTDKAVRIRTKTQWLDGVGMEASQDFKTYAITYPTGITSVPASQFPQ